MPSFLCLTGDDYTLEEAQNRLVSFAHNHVDISAASTFGHSNGCSAKDSAVFSLQEKQADGSIRRIKGRWNCSS